jgi:predicted CXXCH cytochrome family protein
MRSRAVTAGLLLAAVLPLACSSANRHRLLSTFFDGVPPPGGREAAAAPAGESGGPAERQAAHSEHGPFAARLCQSCHQAGAMNALVAPGDALCFRCHDLRLDKPYVHGPLASGGCLVCHDPHRSRYPALLVSASDGFCSHCHAASSLQPIRGHESSDAQCTACHDAHMSDRPHLLK